MSQLRLRTPLTAAALALLLAACGGGSGGNPDQAVSNSPNAPSVSNGLGSSLDNTTDIGASNTSGQQVTPAAPQLTTSAISTAGISGAVLATLLDQPVINLGAGPGVPNYASPTATLGGKKIDDSKGPFITSGQWTDPSFLTTDPTQANNPYHTGLYQPAQGEFTYHHGMSVQNRYRLSHEAAIAFVEQDLKTRLSIIGDTLTLNQPLSVALATISHPNGQYQKRDERTLSLPPAAASRSVSFNHLVPFGQVVQSWQAGTESVQLIVRKGNDVDEVQLCWNTNLASVKRLFCRQHEVPANWTRGQQLKYDSHVIDDDRSAMAGETGHLYWKAEEDFMNR